MDGETLRWVFLGAAVVLLAAEMATTGLFALPFAIGAAAAAIAGFFGVDAAAQLVVCLVVSAASFVALRPLAKRLDRTGITEGIGARRLINESGIVVEAIPSNDAGMIRVTGEEWRAEAVDGRPIAEGTTIRIVEVRGTRALVLPFEAPVPDGPPTD